MSSKLLLAVLGLVVAGLDLGQAESTIELLPPSFPECFCSDLTLRKDPATIVSIGIHLALGEHFLGPDFRAIILCSFQLLCCTVAQTDAK